MLPVDGTLSISINILLRFDVARNAREKLLAGIELWSRLEIILRHECSPSALASPG